MVRSVPVTAYYPSTRIYPQGVGRDRYTPNHFDVAITAPGYNMSAGFLAPTPMTNRGKIFFESEPAALAAHGPLPQISEPVLPPPGTYPSGEELARRLEYFVNVELNAAELKDKRAKRRR